MTAKKAYFIFLALLASILLGIGAIVYFSRAFLTNNANELVAKKLELETVDRTELVYRTNKLLYEKNKDTADLLATIIPAEKDQARAVRDITQIATAYDLSLRSVNFPGSDLNSAKKTATNETAAKASVSQAKPVAGLNGVLGMEVSLELTHINVSNSISTNQVLGFLERIENNRRNIRVTSINFGTAVDEGKTLKVNALLFIKP